MTIHQSTFLGQDEGEGSTETGENRHRLPEAARRLLQVADKTQDVDARRSLLRGQGVRNQVGVHFPSVFAFVHL